MYSFIYFSLLKMFIFIFLIENNPLGPCLYSIPVGVDLSFYYSTGIWQYNIMTGSFVTTQRLKMKSVSGSVFFFQRKVRHQLLLRGKTFPWTNTPVLVLCSSSPYISLNFHLHIKIVFLELSHIAKRKESMNRLLTVLASYIMHMALLSAENIIIIGEYI